MSSQAKIFVLNNKTEAQPPCQSCMKRGVCPVLQLIGSSAESTATMLTYRSNETVVEANEAFKGLYMVRSGFFKSSFIDASGEMQVTGFHLPGDLFGIEGIDNDAYGDTVTALDTGSVCRIPLSVFSADNSSSADPMLTLVKLMSGAISRDRNMIFNLGRMHAKRRFATFLLDVSTRMQRSGYSAESFRLPMSRIDIANYLCLALETISRLFSQLHAQNIIAVDRREIRIIDRDALQALADDTALEGPAQRRKAG